MKANVAITHSLAIATALVVPLGSFLTRSVVELPAWRHLGPVAWAAFSREADLGNGKLFYSLFRIGGTLLAVATALSYRLTRTASCFAAISIYLTALFAFGVILATTQAAPAMLSLKYSGDDEAVLQNAFDRFTRWQSVRATCIALGYISNLWSVLAIRSSIRDAAELGTDGSPR